MDAQGSWISASNPESKAGDNVILIVQVRACICACVCACMYVWCVYLCVLWSLSDIETFAVTVHWYYSSEVTLALKQLLVRKRFFRSGMQILRIPTEQVCLFIFTLLHSDLSLRIRFAYPDNCSWWQKTFRRAFVLSHTVYAASFRTLFNIFIHWSIQLEIAHE